MPEIKEGMKDYRVDVKFRNNRILERIENAGFSSVSGFCKAFGMSYSTVIAVIAMKEPALKKDGEWREAICWLADALQCNPEDLFTEKQKTAEHERTRFSFSVNDPGVLSYDDEEAKMLQSPDDLEYYTSTSKAIQDAMECLSDRERDIVMRYYGLGDRSEETFGDIAEDVGVTPARVREICMKAEKKIRKRLHGMSKDAQRKRVVERKGS